MENQKNLRPRVPKNYCVEEIQGYSEDEDKQSLRRATTNEKVKKAAIILNLFIQRTNFLKIACEQKKKEESFQKETVKKPTINNFPIPGCLLNVDKNSDKVFCGRQSKGFQYYRHSPKTKIPSLLSEQKKLLEQKNAQKSEQKKNNKKCQRMTLLTPNESISKKITSTNNLGAMLPESETYGEKIKQHDNTIINDALQNLEPKRSSNKKAIIITQCHDIVYENENEKGN